MRARLLGKTRGRHAECSASIEIKCGKCGQLVLVSLDPEIPPSTAK
jgi:phage FluMu protein Com